MTSALSNSSRTLERRAEQCCQPSDCQPPWIRWPVNVHPVSLRLASTVFVFLKTCVSTKSKSIPSVRCNYSRHIYISIVKFSTRAPPVFVFLLLLVFQYFDSSVMWWLTDAFILRTFAVLPFAVCRFRRRELRICDREDGSRRWKVGRCASAAFHRYDCGAVFICAFVFIKICGCVCVGCSLAWKGMYNRSMLTLNATLRAPFTARLNILNVLYSKFFFFCISIFYIFRIEIPDLSWQICFETFWNTFFFLMCGICFFFFCLQLIF